MRWKALAIALLALPAAIAPSGFLLSAAALAIIVGILTVPRLTIPCLVVALGFQGVAAQNLQASLPDLAEVIQSIDEIALLAAAVRVAASLLGGEHSWFRVRDWVWALAFVAIGGVSSIIHWNGAKPALLGLALACKFFGFLALVMSVPWKQEDGERLVRALGWVAPLLLVAGVIGYLFPDITVRYFAGDEVHSEFSRGGVMPFMIPFTNPGLYGWMMAVGTLAWFTLLVEGRSQLSLVGLSSGAAGVIMSLRRRPLLGLPVAIIGAITRLRGRRRALGFATAGLLVIGIAWFGMDRIRITIVDTMENYVDPTAREQTARGAMTGVSLILAGRSFPFGEGFGRYGGYAAQRYYSSLYDEFGLSQFYGLSPDSPYYLTDTYWPHLLGEAGVFGLLAMLGALVYYWRIAAVVHRDERFPRSVRVVALFGSLVLLEGLVESVGGPVFEFPLQALMIALPVGMALRASQTTLESREQPMPESKPIGLLST